MPTVTIPALLDHLAAGDTVLLPTASAAADLRAAWNTHHQTLGQSSWPSPAAYSWQQWTNHLWSDLLLNGLEPRLLLNPSQELALWREILAEPLPDTTTPSSPETLAPFARDAFHLAARTNALHRLRSAANSPDTRTFAQWAEAFQRLCTLRSYLSPALLNQALQQHIEAQTLNPPQTLHLVSFPEETPSQLTLLEACTRHHTTLHRHTLIHTPDTTEPVRIQTTAPTEQAELTLAARWLRAFLEGRQSSNQPTRVAVLLPQPSEDRDTLEAVLREHLAPELNHLAADLSATPWEFSTGPALSTLPLVATALALAHWPAHPLSIDTITTLLLAPCLAQNASPAHRAASAQLDATLRRSTLLHDDLTLPQLLTLADRTAQPHPTILQTLHNIQTTLERFGALQNPRSFADWGELLRDLLRAANWPGNRPLNPTEFAATQAWDALLDTLATLDFQGRRVPYPTFLAELDRQAAATAFAPPATHAPIQIMPPHEAVARTFDAVLLLRATDANLPAAEHTHPLLPWPLQRDLQMPGTDPARTNARAHQALLDLLACSNTILCTLAAEDADGPLRPSPLLTQLNLQPLTPTELLPATPTPDPIPLENILDDTPLPPLTSSEVPGGASVLKLQAACGFRAFAEIRLRATQPDSPTLGLDAGESGSFLHKTLQDLWSVLRTQDALSDLPPDERRQLLADCIDAALPRRLRADTPWDHAYLDVQKRRLHTVLSDWLDIELQRAPFTVLAVETQQKIPIGPLTLDVRLDRLDRIGDPASPDTGFVLVDYKSGLSGHPHEWQTDRPQDPQLPLYALLHEAHELKGLAFAKVRPGKEMRWLGLQSEEGLLPNPRSNPIVDLPDRLDEWRSTLTQLAEDFAAGHAEVSPRDFYKDCVRCAQRLLCRVDPLALTTPTTDDTTEDADV